MKRAYKRIAVITVLFLLISVTAGLTAYADGLTSEYRTRNEIRAYIAAFPSDDVQTTYDPMPVLTSPFDTGKLSDASLNDALNTINQYRFIAGLPDVTLDADYVSGSQTLALIMAVNGQPSYYPAQPAGMDDSMFSAGTAVVLGSNLSMGYTAIRDAIVNSWMPDSDSGNIVRCAHRRRMLNPALGKVGFGQVGNYSAMYVKDASVAALATTVAWPAQNTPVALFPADSPWTLSVGVAVDLATVTVTAENSDRQWHFTGAAEANTTGADGYFNITNSDHGQPGCIIFRPVGVTCAAGDSYIVTVNYTATDAAAKTCSYRVRFFDPVVADDPALSDEPYAASVSGTDLIERISGNSRIKTGVAISSTGWEHAKTVVIANGYSFPDALAGVPLAAACDAPILLTAGDTLEPEVRAELKRLGAEKVYLLGGSAVVSTSITSSLTSLGLTVTRLAGDTRYGTAVSIAKELLSISGEFSTVYFASASNFPDALAVSPVAAIESNPILYISPTDSLDKDTAAFVDDASCWNAVILGGDKSVSAVGESSISGLGMSIVRIAGSNRYDTALKICKAYSSLFSGSDIAVATGVSFPDALAGGALAAKQRIPMILLGSSADNALREYSVARRGTTGKLIVFGGVNSVSQTALDSLKVM